MKDYKVKIEIKLKPVVLDPQGRAVLTALRNLGYDELQDARIGKLIELKVRDDDPKNVRLRVNDMCSKLLANPVIEDFTVRVEE